MTPRSKDRWQTAAWFAAVVVSLALVLNGLAGTFNFDSYPEPASHGAILAGSLLAAAAAAAAWARLSGRPWRVALFVGAPALLVGWTDLIAPDSLMPHLGSLVAVPLALTGLLLRRTGRADAATATKRR